MGSSQYPVLCLAGGVVSGLSFFLPWAGAGIFVETGAELGGILWVTFISAAGIVGTYFHFHFKGEIFKARLPIIACAVSSLAVMTLKLFAFLNSGWSAIFDLEFGSVASFLGFLLALYGTSHLPRE